MACPEHRGPAVALAVFYVLLTVGTIVGFAAFQWRPPLASHEGAGIDRVISYLMIVTGGIIVAGHVVLVYFVLRGSSGEAALGRPSPRAQWLWALVPVVAMLVLSEVGVLVLGSPTWAALYVEQPEDPLVLRVVGKQFEWWTHYPGPDGVFGRTDPKLVHDRRNPLGLDDRDPAALDDVLTRSLHLPVDRNVKIRLVSQDVLHSFFVPHFRVKQDLIPGIETSIQFRPNRTGEYELACAELCGLGHYRMKALVYVKEPEEFNKWLAAEEPWFGE